MNDLLTAFEVLLAVYKDGAYCNLQLNKTVDRSEERRVGKEC